MLVEFVCFSLNRRVPFLLRRVRGKGSCFFVFFDFAVWFQCRDSRGMKSIAEFNVITRRSASIIYCFVADWFCLSCGELNLLFVVLVSKSGVP